MIEQDRYCIDVLNQISAVRSTLDALGVEILTNHLESRVLKSGNGGEHPKAKTINPEELIIEVRSVVSRFVRETAALVARSGKRSWCAGLHRLRGVFLAAVGARALLWVVALMPTVVRCFSQAFIVTLEATLLWEVTRRIRV